jgi:tetratricopeptide (TPR) repeat protein
MDAKAMAELRAELRALGNDHFRAARYEQALTCYTDALALPVDDGMAHMLHANRSAALHSLGRLDQALAAGMEATLIAPDYAKGYLRVANAYESLDRLTDAIAACTRVAQLDASQCGPMDRRLEQLQRRIDPASWRISRFSEVLRSHTQGQTLESKPFLLGGHRWRFTMNPCGKSSHPDGISLYLRYIGNGSVTAAYTLVVELSDEIRLGTHTCSKRFERDTTWGSLNIVDRAATLERCADDALIVRLCNLHIIDTLALTEPDNSATVWTIRNFSRWVECSSSSANAVESDSFQMHGHVWSFKIRPCGRSDAPDDVSLFLVYNGAASFGAAFLNMLMLNNTTVAYTLRLQRTDGVVISEETQLNTFVVGQDLGSRHFANREEVLKKTRADDAVVVRLCNVRIVDTVTTADKDGGALWTIPRFGELVRCTKEDHHMQSDSFTMDGEPWRFWIYPCGQSSAPDGISLFLQYTGTTTVTAVFTLQLQQPNGATIDHVTYSHLFAPEDTWGSRPFSSRKMALDRIVSDDKLVIRVCGFRKVDRSTIKQGASVLWTIPRFSQLVRASKTDLLVESDLFEMEGEQWRLMAKPCGATEAAGDIAVYLRYLGAAASVTASYTLQLLKSDTSRPLATRTFAAHKFGPDTSWGTNTIADRLTVLEEIRQDDTLIVAVVEMNIPDTQVGADEALEAAEQWFAEQRWRDAANAYTKALEAGHDKVHYVHQRKAFCYNELGKHAEALKEWDSAVRAHPQCAFSRCKRGEQNLKLGRMKKAEKDALHALKFRPDYPEATELLKSATNPALLLPEKRSTAAKHSAAPVPTSEAQEAFDDARRLEDAGEWTEAIAAYIKAVKAGYTQSYSCHNRQGICFTKLGQHEEAFHQFDTAVSLAPEEATLYYNRGRQHLVLSRLKEAEADALKALELKPDHQLARKLQEDARKRLAVPMEARDAFQNAKGLEDKGDWAAAISAYARAIDSGYPQAFACHNRQGICFAKLGLHEEAFRQFDTAVNLAPNDVASLRNRARKHQAFGRLRQAELDALRAVELKPDNGSGRKLLEDVRAQMAEAAETAFQTAQTLRLRKQFHEAIDAYAKAIENGHPNLFTCYNNRSLCHTMLGQHQLALQDNIDCIKEDPTDPMGYDHRARTYMDLGKLELAESDAQMTLELDPEFDGADEFLESVRQQLKVPAAARGAFSEATTLYKEDERWIEAAEAFMKAIEDGHNEIARCHLYRGSCFEKLGRLNNAMKEYDLAVDKGSDDYRGWFTRGVTYRRRGKTREATSDCNRGMELASASILSNPGLLDEILGPDVAKAIEELPDREQQRAVRPLAASMMAKTLFAMKIWEAAAAAYTLMFKPAGCIEPMGVKILPPPQIMHQGHHDRGICYQNLSRHAEAYEDFNAAVKGQPTNAGAWFRRAQEQSALGRFHDAEADLNHALSLSPSEPGAKELLEVVRKELKSKKVDAEMTQNLLLKELEEEEERAAKKKEKKKRQKQKKKQKAKGNKTDPVEAETTPTVAEENSSDDVDESIDSKDASVSVDPQEVVVGGAGMKAPNKLKPKPKSKAKLKAKAKGPAAGDEGGALGSASARASGASGTTPGVYGQGSASGQAAQSTESRSRKRTESGRGANAGSVTHAPLHSPTPAMADSAQAYKKGRPRTVQEAMSAGGFDRLKKTGGWLNDLCGPQPLHVVLDLVKKGSKNSQDPMRLGTLAEELKSAWNASSVNVGALGCYVRYYDKCFDLEAVQGTVKGIPANVKVFAPVSIISLLFSGSGNSNPVSSEAKASSSTNDKVSEEHAVQQLVDHITQRSREGKVTKMSALAGLFLNAKDKAILSRFGDLRPVLLKYGGTLKGFLEHHRSIFSITEDHRIGDCVVEVWTKQNPKMVETVQKPTVAAPQKSDLAALDERDCPLCCEPFDTTDMEFQPCGCSYRVCLWCFHRIRDDGDGKCPSCRNTYQSGGVPMTEKQRSTLRQRRQQSLSTAPTPVTQVSGQSDTTSSGSAVASSDGTASVGQSALPPRVTLATVNSPPAASALGTASAGGLAGDINGRKLSAREKATPQRTARQQPPSPVVAVQSSTTLSEDAVVKLLVDKINARSRDGKTTKASALAGGLFQADGRYGDLRPVLLKYEGTIHGFLRYHISVFLLEDPLGRPNSDDPIVRVRPSHNAAISGARLNGGASPIISASGGGANSSNGGSGAISSGSTTGGSGSGGNGASGSGGHGGGNSGAAAGSPASAGNAHSHRSDSRATAKASPPSNPWKVEAKQPTSFLNTVEQQKSTGHGQANSHHGSAVATIESPMRMKASDMLPTSIFDDEDDLPAMPVPRQFGNGAVFAAGQMAEPSLGQFGVTQSYSGGGLGGSAQIPSSWGGPVPPAASSVVYGGASPVSSSRWVPMATDSTSDSGAGSDGATGAFPNTPTMPGIPVPMPVPVPVPPPTCDLVGSIRARSHEPVGASRWSPAAKSPATAFGSAFGGRDAFITGADQDIWGTADDIDSAFGGADPGAAFGEYGASATGGHGAPSFGSAEPPPNQMWGMPQSQPRPEGGKAKAGLGVAHPYDMGQPEPAPQSAGFAGFWQQEQELGSPAAGHFGDRDPPGGAGADRNSLNGGGTGNGDAARRPTQPTASRW